MRTLVLGGYGNFGARICRELDRRGIEVIAAGRHPDAGRATAGLKGSIGTAALDLQDPAFARKLEALRPATVVHCVGPFQGQDYRVVDASVAAYANYIDLADARAFVAGFERHIDGEAIENGVVALSGASTLPALSTAVIDALQPRLASIDEIQIAIAPAQRSPRGVATLQAVFSYLGKPFDWREHGGWRQATGWQELRRLHFKDLGWRWAAACDVPDLVLLPDRYRSAQTIQFRAALEFSFEHFVLAGLAELRKRGVAIPMERWAAPFERMASLLDRWGAEKGGMLVSLTGKDAAGKAKRVEWHLTAGWREGPEIPCLAALILAEQRAKGIDRLAGGRPCVAELALKDFEPEFRRLGIETAVIESAP